MTGRTATAEESAVSAGTADSPAAATKLACRSLEKSYGRGVRAVDGVSLDVMPGERLGVIGPNGSGKTTLFNCLSGQTPVSAGRVYWNGQDVTSWSSHRRARHGLVRTFQHVAVFGDLTVAEAARRAALCRRAMGSKASSEPVSTNAADIPELLAHCGLESVAERPVSDLAYGTQKLVNVVMALVTGPQLLMLDEPAAGLSAEEASHLGEVLASMADRGLTFCLVDHNMPFLSSLCTRVIVLDAGRVVCEGTPSEVRHDPEVRRVYLGNR